MIILRSDVRVHGISAEIVLGLTVCAQVLKERFKVDIQVTSGIEGKHGHNSLHHTGDAVDFWPKQLIQNPLVTGPAMVDACKNALGQDYDCIFETGRIHIHLEFQPHAGYG